MLARDGVCSVLNNGGRGTIIGKSEALRITSAAHAFSEPIMADIFISYKREDRDRVEPFAQALEHEGFSVWWDPELLIGHSYSSSIRAELGEAREPQRRRGHQGSTRLLRRSRATCRERRKISVADRVNDDTSRKEQHNA